MAEAATEDHIRELLRRSGNPYRITRDPTIPPPSDELILPPPAELTLPGVAPRAAQDDAGQEPSLAPAQRQAMEGMIADEGRRQADADSMRPKPLPKPDLSAGRQQMADTRRAAAARTPEQSAADAESFADETLRRRQVASDSAKARNDKADTMQRDRSIASDRAAQDAWWAKHQAWQAQMDAAIETGNFPLQQRLRAAEPKQPAMSLESTGGKTVEELQEPVEETLEKVRQQNPEAAAALDGLPEDSLNANFSDLPPDERLHAMMASGQRLSASRPEVAGLSGGTRGGVGRPGTRLMPENRVQPRSFYDVGPGKPAGTPRSTFETETGAPRRNSRTIDTFGGTGPMAAPAPSTDDILAGVDLNAPEHTGEEKKVILLAAHQMGLDLSRFDDSPRGQAMALHEAKRMVRAHQERTAGGKQVIVASDDPDNPYRYAESPATKKARETRDLVRRTHEYIGHHPLPGNADPDLHKKLLEAAKSGDMKTYQELRAQLRGLEIQGQNAMMVQRRKMKALTHQMNDPEIRQGVFSQAMQDAGDDPQAQARVMRQFGFFDQANQILGLEAQKSGIQDARDRAWTQLGIDQMQAANPKGVEQPQEDADTAITNKVDSNVQLAKAGEGGGTYESTKTALGMAKVPADQIRSRFLQSAKKHGLPINHPELAPALIDEWVNGDYTHLYGGSYLEQFVRNVARQSGFSEDEVRRWAETNAETLRRHSYGKEGWSDQQPAGAQAPMPASQPVTVTGK